MDFRYKNYQSQACTLTSQTDTLGLSKEVELMYDMTNEIYDIEEEIYEIELMLHREEGRNLSNI